MKRFIEWFKKLFAWEQCGSLMKHHGEIWSACRFQKGHHGPHENTDGEQFLKDGDSSKCDKPHIFGDRSQFLKRKR